MTFFTILKTLASLLPLLLQIINSLETALPETGNGPKKLSALKTIVQSAYSVATDTGVAFEKIWPVIEVAVSGLVTMFKK